MKRIVDHIFEWTIDDFYILAFDFDQLCLVSYKFPRSCDIVKAIDSIYYNEYETFVSTPRK